MLAHLKSIIFSQIQKHSQPKNITTGGDPAERINNQPESLPLPQSSSLPSAAASTNLDAITINLLDEVDDYGPFVPILGLGLLILICLVAFVVGANAAKRQKDYSYALQQRNDRNQNRRYQTFTIQNEREG